MTIEATPTEMAKSAAICGSSVSAARTRAWLAKLASASAAMARIGSANGPGRARGMALTASGVAGFVPRHQIQAQ